MQAGIFARENIRRRGTAACPLLGRLCADSVGAAGTRLRAKARARVPRLRRGGRLGRTAAIARRHAGRCGCVVAGRPWVAWRRASRPAASRRRAGGCCSERRHRAAPGFPMPRNRSAVDGQSAEGGTAGWLLRAFPDSTTRGALRLEP